jgi:DNA invertase Pin-like site-specific DNA recombinase
LWVTKTTDAQRQSLGAIVAQRQWAAMTHYEDHAIGGRKGRDKRPGLDTMLKDGARVEFEVLIAWLADRRAST